MYFLDHVGSPAPVGVMSIARRRWKTGNKNIHAGIIADLVVDSHHRSLGPAVKLHNESLALALQNLDFVYGFPNSHSVTLAKFARFKLVEGIYRYAKPIRLSSYLRGRFPPWLALPAGWILDSVSSWLTRLRSLPISRRWKSGIFSGFDAGFDRLWHSIDTKHLIIGQRDSPFLAWRFSLNKAQSYRVFGITDKRTGQLEGYVVYAIDRTGFVTIADLLALDAHKTLRALFLLFERRMRRERRKAVSFTFHGCSAVVKNLEALGFRRRELQPFCCTWSLRFAELMDGKEWYFTAADNDV
jgi:hypothetical protein